MPKVWGIHDCQSDTDLRPAGCGIFRVIFPLDALRDQGWDVGYAAGTPPPDALSADIMVGQRFDKPEVLGAWRRLRARHKLVYEIDDNVFDVDPLNYSAYRNFQLEGKREAVRHCAQVADLVTVTTEPLAQIMREFNPNVRVLNNAVPARLLEMERPRKEALTVGWTGGCSHARDIAEAAAPLRRFMERDRKDAHLHFIGTDYRRTVTYARARYSSWEIDPWDYWAKIDFDIGLAPLAGTGFNDCKSHVKALEYAALGIPVIASDAPPYRDFVIDGVTGFLVRNSAQLRDRLNVLASDEKLRESMGAKAREQASLWTSEARALEWDKAYRSIL